MSKSIAVGGSGAILLIMVILLVWLLPGSRQNGGHAPAAQPPEVRAASQRAMAIAAKEDNPAALEAQDWAQTNELLSSQDWRIRARGLTVLSQFSGTTYEPEAWQIALRFLSGESPVDRAYAASAVSKLRPVEAPRYIAPLLEDRDPDVRKQVEDLLSRLGYSRRKQ